MRAPLVLLLVLAAAAPAAAASDEDVAQQRALVMLRVLAYDHNLTRRSGDVATVVVLYGADAERSRREHGAMRAALAGLEKLRVAGRPLRVVSAEYSDAGALRSILDQVQPSALYLCAGLDSEVARVAATTRASRVLSFGASEDHVRAGLSVAIVAAAPRARLLINLAAAKAEGVDFDAGLLRLAEVVR